jgi:hypothetical protein
MSDHLQLTAMTTVRVAWLLALLKLTVVGFFAIFLALLSRRSIRKTGGCDEALGIALAIGSLISFVSMILASQVGEAQALKLHATELLLLLGTAIVLLVERPIELKVAEPQGDHSIVHGASGGDLSLQQPQLADNS